MKIVAKKTFDRKVLDVNIELEEHKIYALIGANGSGKSTLLKVLSSVINPDTDSSIDIPFKNDEVYYMPQMPYTFDLSVYNNIKLGIPLKSSPGEKIYCKYRIDTMLKTIDLNQLRKANAQTLSGGEKQKMALIRSLVVKHALLLLDEPTSAMDINATLKAEELIQKYKEEFDGTIIMATHSIKQAQRLADVVLFLDEGEIKEIADAQTFIDHPQSDGLKDFLQKI